MSAMHIYPHLPEKLKPYWRLARVDRPIGTLLLLWPTWWALWLASGGMPSLKNMIIFTLGVFLMRSAGCVINDFADRDIDGHVDRTKDRPLAAGELTSTQALKFFAVLVGLAFVLVLFTDKQTILLSLVALGLATLYPFMKRYTHLPQVVLGAAFAWSVPMAWSAEAGALDSRIWLLYTIVVVWTVCYDTFYAMVDREDDLKIGVKSTAVLFGELDRGITAMLQVAVLWMLFLLKQQFDLADSFYGAWFATASLFAYQQWLISGRVPQRCFKAFLNNNYVGMVVLVGIWISI